jgi:hypothetical protein
MYKVKDMLWTWLLPDVPRDIDRKEWAEHGGKWIVFDRKPKLEELGEKLGPLIDSGQIESAKYWNEDPGAICVYSLDRNRDRTWEMLKSLGAGNRRVWEYDYAWDKNIRDPIAFTYSWFSKFRTIFQSYGFTGSLRLLREIMKPKG